MPLFNSLAHQASSHELRRLKLGEASDIQRAARLYLKDHNSTALPALHDSSALPHKEDRTARLRALAIERGEYKPFRKHA